MVVEFIFDLERQLNYQDSQGDNNTVELLLKPPVGKHERHVSQLQQQLSRATVSAQKLIANNNVSDDSNIEEEDISIKDKADFILTALRISDIDFFEYKKCLYKMLCDDLCFIKANTGNVCITKTLIGDLTLRDKDKLVGEYSAHFIMP